jgi:hypothetical protein
MAKDETPLVIDLQVIILQIVLRCLDMLEILLPIDLWQILLE